MKLRVVTFGKIKKGPHDEIGDEYIKRTHRYFNFEIVSVKEEKKVFEYIKKGDFVALCDEKGSEMDSLKFAAFIREKQIASKDLVFVIGPAEGVSDALKKAASFRLAFSKFTLQHDLAMIVLLEQIYRAGTIIAGEKYHK